MVQRLRSHMTLNNGVLAVALLITLSWVWGTVGAIQQNFQLQQQVDSLSQQIGFQTLQNQAIQFQNQYYNSPEYLELAARDHLTKSNPGEKLLILPPNTKHDNPQQNTATIPIAQRSNFQQWLYFLFGNKG